MKRIRFFNDLLTEKFGSVLHRIPFDLGLSCPNRVNGPGPCAFCAADGIFHAGEIMSAIDGGQRPVIGGLDADLQP